MVSKKKLAAFSLLFIAMVFALYNGVTWYWAIITFVLLVFYVQIRRKIKKYIFLSLYLVRLLFKRGASYSVSDNDAEGILILKLPDGRKISYRQYGAADGMPVFYFHGTPGSSLEPLLINQQILIDHKIRVIAPNRPGIGLSDMVEKRGFSNWPADVISLANHLDIGRFAVWGFSGGSTYAAACAAIIPDRLTAAVIVSGAWQMNLPEAKHDLSERYRLFWKMADKIPFMLPYMMRSLRILPKKPEEEEKELEQLKNFLPESDYNFVKENGRLKIMHSSINEAVMNIKGAACDVRIYVKNWDFRPGNIQMPVTMFHGRLDRNVPVALAEKIAQSNPLFRLFILEKDAHLSLLDSHIHPIISALKGEEVVTEPEVNTEKKEVTDKEEEFELEKYDPSQTTDHQD